MDHTNTLPSVLYVRLFFCVYSGHLDSLLRSNWVLRGYTHTHLIFILCIMTTKINSCSTVKFWDYLNLYIPLKTLGFRCKFYYWKRSDSLKPVGYISVYIFLLTSNHVCASSLTYTWESPQCDISELVCRAGTITRTFIICKLNRYNTKN